MSYYKIKVKRKVTESMKKLGKIQKSMPKWKRNSQTKSLIRMRPTYRIIFLKIKSTRKTRV